MKTKIISIILICFLLFNVSPLTAQSLRMLRPLKFELSGVKNGEIVKEMTKDFEIDILRDGNIRLTVNLNNINIFIDANNNPREFRDEILIVQGIYPIAEAQSNETLIQNYRFDLDIINDQISESKLFDVRVNYNQGSNISNVTMITTIDLRQYEDLYKYGLEPIVNMIISFETKLK